MALGRVALDGRLACLLGRKRVAREVQAYSGNGSGRHPAPPDAKGLKRQAIMILSRPLAPRRCRAERKRNRIVSQYNP
jgi:hypothetical protein